MDYDSIVLTTELTSRKTGHDDRNQNRDSNPEFGAVPRAMPFSYIDESKIAVRVPENGVDEGIRTLDIHVGNVILYQLSYIHMEHVAGIEPA